MKQRIEVEEHPKSVPMFHVPSGGICFLHKNGTEVYVRSCPKCGSPMEISHSTGKMPVWDCPARKSSVSQCSYSPEPVARMSKGLLKDLSRVSQPVECWKCGGEDVRVEILRRKQRVEVITRHPEGHACDAVSNTIFHTFESEKQIVQNWEEDPGKFDKSVLDNLDTVSKEEADKMIEDSKAES